MQVLLIDNYDSFSHNVFQLFRGLGAQVCVFRNDSLTVGQAAAMSPERIIISPGPKRPADSGISIELIKSFTGRIPILGICLGMQAINEAFGGSTVRAPVPVHGKTSLITRRESRIFHGVRPVFRSARYHSLMVAGIPDSLRVTAVADDGVVMAIEHTDHPTFGLQFHPESFLSEDGPEIAANFLSIQ